MNSSEIMKSLKNPSRLGEVTLPLLKNMVREYPWFSTGWVLYLKNLKNLNDPDFTEQLNRVALRVHDRKMLKSFLDSPGKDVTGHLPQEHLTGIPDYLVDVSGSDETGSSEKADLIENFLAQGARFSNPSPRSTENQPIDLAEKAVAISDDIVTEKFAALLLDQKKFEEAIVSFQKLSLKYPEKSIYFAARIEEIRKLMNF